MAPAFSSSRQAAAFGLMLVVLLSMPVLLAKVQSRDRRDVYPTIAWKYGAYPWFQQQIFAETGDVDMAFLGASHMLNNVDAPYVKSELSQHIGRDATVFTLGWPWPGYDAMYFIARDLLEHRRVRILVIDDVNRSPDRPHPIASRWYRYGENTADLEGLPFASRMRLYSSAVLGTPRHILSLFRTNLLEDPAHCKENYWNKYYHSPNIAQNLGTHRAQISYGMSSNFSHRSGQGSASPSDVILYSAETDKSFKFTGPKTRGYQLHFLRRLTRLCQDHGTHLVMLHEPSLSDRSEESIFERECWPETLGAPIDIVGISTPRLLAGIPEDDVKKYFYDNAHFNENGQKLFTPLISPSLLEIYDTSINRH